MTSLVSSFVNLFIGWANVVAELAVNGLDRLFSPKVVRLIERTDGGFLLYPDGRQPDRSVGFALEDRSPATATIFRGSRVEIVLASRNFIFRTLELPLQAADFVEGIVRAQVDRLSPWTVSTAIFGCGAPRAIDAARMATEVAIMPRQTALAMVQPVLDLKPASVAIVANPEDAGRAQIKVFEQKLRGLLDPPRVARTLLVLLAVCSIAAVICAIGAMVIGSRLDAQRESVAQQIAQSQMLLRAGNDTPQSSAVRALERQKYDTAALTLALEALTKALPDHTFLTELHVMADKLQIVGVSRDAPSLIRLIEQSPSFTRATFFAPTTRSVSNTGEQFHIEARLQPVRMGLQP